MNMNERVMVLDGGRRVLFPKACQSPSGSLGFEQVKTILGSDKHSVLVTGDTGTGKEAFADCAFQLTKLAKGRCQKINCAGMDRNLIGSELFGHLKGAYTGADSTRVGLLKECDGGILFLDEIGWLPPDLQARLLRFMDSERGDIRPLGADKVTSHAKVRIIAATNKDVSNSATMLHDLRHRFDFELALPSLGERGADIFWFLCEPGCLGGQDVYTGVSLRALIALMSRTWTGNVRELKKYCQRKVLFRPTDSLMEGEQRHVLYDFDLWHENQTRAVIWRNFAGLALQLVEGSESAGFRFEPDAWRGVAAVAAVYQAMLGYSPHTLFGSPGPIMPLHILRAYLTGEFDPIGRFDLLPFAKILAKNERTRDFSLVGYAARARDADLFTFWAVIQGALFKNPALQEKWIYPQIADDPGLQNAVGPSDAFLDRCSSEAVMGSLFYVCKVPAGVETFTAKLGRLGIDAQDYAICVRYHGGASCANIAKELKIGLATVKEHLAELRRKHNELAPFLTKKPAGRKAKK